MTTTIRVTPRKIGWFEAAGRFILNKGEVGNFHKVAGSIGVMLRTFGLTGTVVSVFDDALTFIPGIDFITLADNVMWLYGAYALYRIYKIRKEANRPRIMRRK